MVALLSLASILLLALPAEAFVSTVNSPSFGTKACRRTQQRSAAPLHLSLFPSSDDYSLADSLLSQSSLLLSTVDADIAKLSDNEFAPIFAGGILVMFGGLLSALVVGTIVDQKNLYASIVADSYVQGADDEEFWKGLSEEEKKKTQELLNKIKRNNNGESVDDSASTEVSSEAVTSLASTEAATKEAVTAAAAPAAVQAKDQKPKVIDMFSDYADN
jgi:hypothetical protein